MKRIVVIVVAAIALLGASPAAATKTFTYRAQFDGVGKSSILFDAKGTDKGTDFFSIRHISIWHIPFDCGAQAPTHGVFFLGGPVPVGYDLFDFDGSSDTLSIAFNGGFYKKGSVASGHFSASDTSTGCATDGAVHWKGKRLK